MNEWGFDYNAKTIAANKTLEALSNGIPADKLEAYKSDPYLKRIMSEVHGKISEDVLITGNKSGSMSVQEMKQEISSFVGDKSSAYWNQNAIDHKETVAKVTSMYQALDKAEKQNAGR